MHVTCAEMFTACSGPRVNIIIITTILTSIIVIIIIVIIVHWVGRVVYRTRTNLRRYLVRHNSSLTNRGRVVVVFAPSPGELRRQ